ncbi:unnamed protein product [Kluyveromyces dobzhanskii CBS 2104]|uniref:WGS project CCBQ000000000 data, contig 00106 n=1 Tax=Kluyveromyces dobzhanskii CBS 2104 TaxID=1427455 RepID=A0A0A8L7Z9_9SACH|nr:unnamed protein product [Kluyveromyces dobzhanskii CBS 2104]
MNYSMNAQEDGVKLREEVHYKHFYPDLDVNDLVIFNKDQIRELRDDQNSDEVHYNNEELRNILKSWKQLIVNDSIRVEKLGPQIKNAEFKRCGIQISQLNANRKVNKQMTKYGYRSHTDHISESHKNSYSKKTDLLMRHRNELFGDISPYQANFKVEYDMDEQDDLFLRHLNSTLTSSKQKVTHEIFEIVVTVLENEAFHLEKKIPPRESPSANNNTHESHAAWKHHELYGSDDGTGYPLDQPCAVCGGIECDNSNAIVFCDGCDIAVHQECYGVVFIPEGQWLCRRCMISKNRKLECLFCPSTTGAFKQTDNGSWGHVLCGIWIPELYFGNLHYMEPIGGIENIPKSRWKLTCYICKQEVGACVQCSNKNCFAAYHTTCGKRAGLYMNFNGCTVQEAASKNFTPGAFLESCCHKHSPKDWGNCQEGIYKTREYFKNVNANNKTSDESSAGCRMSSAHKNTKNKWKTSRGTLIAPQAFVEILQKILSGFHVSNAEQISLDICKYWTMKRELKRGAPLVRKFSPSSLNTLSIEELGDRIAFSEVLLQDLNKLENIASSLVAKQQCNIAMTKNANIINQIAFHPVRYMLKNVVWSNVAKTISFKSYLQLESLSDRKVIPYIYTKLENDEYPSIQDFAKDVAENFTSIMNNENTSRSLVIMGSKLLNEFNRCLSKIDELDVQTSLHYDFDIDPKTQQVEEVAWKSRKYLESEGLEDVEDLSIKQERQLKGWLRD